MHDVVNPYCVQHPVYDNATDSYVVVEPTKKFDEVGFIMEFEYGGLNDDQIIDGFQALIDSGTVWHLQGQYGRTAASLIQQGYCIDTHGVLG